MRHFHDDEHASHFSHLGFFFGDGLLLGAMDVLEALQERQQWSAGALGGALVVHLPGAALPQPEQQQDSRQQLTGERDTGRDTVGGCEWLGGAGLQCGLMCRT